MRATSACGYLFFASSAVLWPAWPSAIAGEAAVGKEASPASLRLDAKLRATVSLTSAIELGEILTRLEKATGLTFDVADHLLDHHPRFSGLGVEKVAAWSVMSMVSATELDAGRWLKTPTGYRLTAKASLTTKIATKGLPKVGDVLNLDQLKLDPKLHARLTIDGANPDINDIFVRMSKATGLVFKLAGHLAEHRPLLGMVRMEDISSAMLMDFLAKKQLVEGRWRKAEDGYVLTAKESLSAKAWAAKKANDEHMAKATAEHAAFLKMHPLAADHRLHVRVSLVETSPKLSDLLERLSLLTGLNLSLADNLPNHEPDLGIVNLPNTHVYSVLELIAARQLEGGKWEKTAEGYRLTGTSLASAPSVKSRFWNPWTLLVLSSLCLVAAVGFHIYLRRRKTIQAKASGETAPAGTGPRT